MEKKGVVLGLVGSPNPDGRTNQLVSAALEKAAEAGSRVEKIQMADHPVQACKDCLPWVCMTNLKCSYEDEGFEYLSGRVLDCAALVLGTPVYWWDTSGLVKYFILKMFRVYARSAPLRGLPALGIAIAGGTGNGLVSGLRPVYHFFQMMQMRALEPVPATRFNFGAALKRAGALGKRLAEAAATREPFDGLEDRLLWYDSLPYLGLSRAQERRLLADLTTEAIGQAAGAMFSGGLARADSLLAAGEALESLREVTRVYEAGVRAFEEK